MIELVFAFMLLQAGGDPSCIVNVGNGEEQDSLTGIGHPIEGPRTTVDTTTDTTVQTVSGVINPSCQEIDKR